MYARHSPVKHNTPPGFGVAARLCRLHCRIRFVFSAHPHGLSKLRSSRSWGDLRGQGSVPSSLEQDLQAVEALDFKAKLATPERLESMENLGKWVRYRWMFRCVGTAGREQGEDRAWLGKKEGAGRGGLVFEASRQSALCPWFPSTAVVFLTQDPSSPGVASRARKVGM